MGDERKMEIVEHCLRCDALMDSSLVDGIAAAWTEFYGVCEHSWRCFIRKGGVERLECECGLDALTNGLDALAST